MGCVRVFWGFGLRVVHKISITSTVSVPAFFVLYLFVMYILLGNYLCIQSTTPSDLNA